MRGNNILKAFWGSGKTNSKSKNCGGFVLYQANTYIYCNTKQLIIGKWLTKICPCSRQVRIMVRCEWRPEKYYWLGIKIYVDLVLIVVHDGTYIIALNCMIYCVKFKGKMSMGWNVSMKCLHSNCKFTSILCTFQDLPFPQAMFVLMKKFLNKQFFAKMEQQILAPPVPAAKEFYRGRSLGGAYSGTMGFHMKLFNISHIYFLLCELI